MPFQPLTAILLLLYLLLIGAALTAWFALTLKGRTEDETEEETSREDIDELPLSERPSNDEVRGAHARPVQARRASEDDEDPFERFIRSKSDDVRL